MMLSSILDIGSFFIGMIINLLLVTLMCYYFKKKYESLEEAQNEQAKLLYELLQDRKDKAPVKPTLIDMQEIEVSDEESDTDGESDMEEIVASDPVSEVKVLTLETPTETNEPMVIEKSEDLEITLEETNTDDFSKMSMKQLRDLLTEKGVKVKPSMKKNELVELAKL